MDSRNPAPFSNYCQVFNNVNHGIVVGQIIYQLEQDFATIHRSGKGKKNQELVVWSLRLASDMVTSSAMCHDRESMEIMVIRRDDPTHMGVLA